MTGWKRKSSIHPAGEAVLALLASGAFFLLAAVAAPARHHLVLLVALGAAYACLVFAAAKWGGPLYAVPLAIAGGLALDSFYVSPAREVASDSWQNWLVNAIYIAIGVVIGLLGARSQRRAEASDEARGLLAEEQAALRRVATLVARGDRPDAIFAAVAEEVGVLLNVDGARVVSFIGENEILQLEGWAAPGHDPLPTGPLKLEGTSMSGQVLRTGRPVRFDDYASGNQRLPWFVERLGIRSGVAAPVVVDGRLWGAMLAWSLRPHTLPENAESRLAAFTELVAMAISNTASQEELARLADEQAALRRVATLVARGVPPPEVFTAVASELGHLLRVDATHMERYEPDGAAILVGSWSPEETDLGVGRRIPLDDTSVAGLVHRSGRPARMDSYKGATDDVAALARTIGISSSVGAPIVVGGRLWGVMVASSSQPEPLGVDTESRIAAFTELVAAAISNTEARIETARLAEEQAALRRVATLVAEGPAPATLLALVAEEVAHIMHVWSVSIARYEADGTATELASFSDHGEVFPVGTRWSLDGTNVLAEVRETGRPARINDHTGLEGQIAQTVRASGMRSTVGVPIAVAGRLWGAMVVSSTEAEPLPERTAARLVDFTELLATAIANAESREELDASRARIVATADATRRQIERDLHDGAQQQLVSLALGLRSAQAAVPAELDEHRAELSRMVEGLTSVLDELREIARGIHPAHLAEGGLPPALKALGRRSAVPVELELPAGLRLPEREEVAAYYIVSEALTNATKYARASLVQVAVEVRDGTLRVSISDDGKGGADPARGSGLLGLRDRVEAIGGTMSLQSPPGAGTSLHVELPLDDPDTDARTAATRHLTAGR